MRYLSRNQAEQWLNQHTLYGQKKKDVYQQIYEEIKQIISLSSR